MIKIQIKIDMYSQNLFDNKFNLLNKYLMLINKGISHIYNILLLF